MKPWKCSRNYYRFRQKPLHKPWWYHEFKIRNFYVRLEQNAQFHKQESDLEKRGGDIHTLPQGDPPKHDQSLCRGDSISKMPERNS